MRTKASLLFSIGILAVLLLSAPDRPTSPAEGDRLTKGRAASDNRPGASGPVSSPVLATKGLLARFGASGVAYEGASGRWRVHMSAVELRRDGRSWPADAETPEREGGRIVYRHAWGREWYEGRPEGIEQGFDLPSRPEGEGLLRIRIRAEGARVSSATRNRIVFANGPVAVMEYRDLVVTDARGREIEAWMERSGDTISLAVDDAAAVYPIVVDPVALAAGGTVEGNQASAYFGQSLASAGDVNGDGYDDVIVGAPWYDNGETDEGGAFVFHGSPTGISSVPDWSAEGNQAACRFGFSVAGAGDVNGDGFDDVIVGAHAFSNGEADEGLAFVYFGSASGLSTTPDWTGEMNMSGLHFGWAVSTAGDVNGDGYADIAVGAPYYDNPLTNEGAVFVFHGSSAGPSTTPDWTGEGDSVTAFLGYSVSTAGDINGDGYDDLISGAFHYSNGESDEGAAYAWYGSASGLSPLPFWIGESNQAGARAGVSVACAGDVNGDGYDDVIYGAFLYDTPLDTAGRAILHHGSAAGLSVLPDATIDGTQMWEELGKSVAGAGDVNGDGYDDVLIGSVLHDNPLNNEGAAFLFLGSASGISTTPDWAGYGGQASAFYGTCVATAGDVNGDGGADILVGADRYSNGESNEGRAFVQHGTPTTGPPTITGPFTLPDGTVAIAYGPETFTASGAVPITWSVTSGSLPTGLFLSSSGSYSGTPTIDGTFTFTITATNASGSDSATYAHVIQPVPTAPTITAPTVLSDGTEGVAYPAVTFTASGTTPITWSVTAGTPPPGLTLDSSGTYSGTPTTAGTYAFSVTATNGLGSDTAGYTHVINNAPPSITGPASLADGTEGTAYGPITFTASGGVPIIWSVSGGALPPGLTLSSTGDYSGTPTTAGSYTFTVTADNTGGSDSATYTHVIAGTLAAPSIAGPMPLANGTVGSPYTPVAFSASGSTPITWSVTAGSLPPGMTLSASGTYSGTPTAAGTFSFTTTATNSVGSDSQAQTHVIDPPPATLPDPVSSATLSQHDIPGSAAEGVGFVDNDDEMTFSGIVTHPGGGTLALQVEVKPVGTPFDGTGLTTGSFVSSGGTATATVSGLTDGAYQWRARAWDGSLGSAAFTDFGGNASNPPAGTADTDFGIDMAGNTAPDVVDLSTLTQHDSATGPAQAAGFVSSDTTIVFRGVVTDPDGDLLVLQLEIKPVGTPFDGTTGIVRGTGVVSGGVSELVWTAPASGLYQWRARANDLNLPSASWTDFGGNASNPPVSPADIDFQIPSSGSPSGSGSREKDDGGLCSSTASGNGHPALPAAPALLLFLLCLVCSRSRRSA